MYYVLCMYTYSVCQFGSMGLGSKFACLYSNTHLLSAAFKHEVTHAILVTRKHSLRTESCISRVHTKRTICHTPDDATVCCSQTVYSKCAAAMVYTICDRNLKPPILTNILHVMHPWDMQCGISNSSAIECGVVLDTISHCSHNWVRTGYNTWRGCSCMDKGKVTCSKS